MKLAQKLRTWYGALRLRSRQETEMDDEFRFHIESYTEDLVRRGMSRESALRQAQLEFGGTLQARENVRDANWLTHLDNLGRDIRFSFRQLLKNRGLSAVIILTLALGIGANTAIYSFLDAILLRSLPVQHPEQLFILNWTAQKHPPVIHGLSGTGHDGPEGASSPEFAYAAYTSLRAQPGLFTHLFAQASAFELNLVTNSQAEVGRGFVVSGNYFDGLGVRPWEGRLIGDADDQANSPHVVVISFEYWRKYFSFSPSCVGQTILINNSPWTIIGVTPPGFFGVDPSVSPDVFLPLRLSAALSENQQEREKSAFFDPNFYWLEVLGRRAPGVSEQKIKSALAPVFQSFVQGTITSEKERESLPQLAIQHGGAGLDSLRRQYSKPLFVLLALVGVILLIACANVASLLLSRAASRRREIAIRLSLGASRGRVIRQLLTESVLLSFFGGLGGLLFAWWGNYAITWLLATGREDFSLHATLNLPVLLFALALSLFTGILFGLVPALQSTRFDLTPSLKESASQTLVGRVQRINFVRVLVVAQLAFCIPLVISAGLFVRTLSKIRSLDIGFNQHNLLVFNINGSTAGYRGAALTNFYSQLLAEFRRLPGVKSATLTSLPVAAGYWSGVGVTIPGFVQSGDASPSACVTAVDPDYLSTLQIPVLSGRSFEPKDLNSPQVAIVNRVFADTYFPNQNPIGRVIGINESPVNFEIVGIAKTSVYNSVKEETVPGVVYIPFTSKSAEINPAFFMLKTSANPLSYAPAVRKIVSSSNASAPIAELSTQSDLIDRTISQERTFAGLSACFAALALLISSIGLYGTIAYSTAQRTREIGIRRALGAARTHIVVMVIREVAILLVSGLAVGLAIAWATSRFIDSFLFRVQHSDLFVLLLSTLLVLAAAAVAGLFPARRASRVDPLTSLRYE